MGDRLAQTFTRERSYFPRHVDHGETVAPVGLEVKLQDRIAQIVLERCAYRRFGVEDQDALVVFAHTKLSGRADHALGLNSPQDYRLEFYALRCIAVCVVEHGAEQRHRHPIAHGDVHSAGHERGPLCLPVVNGDELQAIGIWMRLEVHDPADIGILPEVTD